ncbi:MAG: enoyl-CoA hydratase/isomerase family protein [Burkholderiaceae bacterium]|nr:enoyl-CoA hydratase/isomerase family protein [Burkholderiaceae bacterium]MCD8536702.1 enoyl-CoA hydratase/isomerase family protein [Burkholderiaceae bacterium]
MNECLQTKKDGSVWTLSLNRPDKRNALDAELVEALIDAVEQAQAVNVDVLVLRGEGKNFCAGFDFTGFERLGEGELLWRFVRIEQLLQMLNHLPVLTVALAHGKNFGAGVDLMAACKHRVASPDATFRMPGLKFGLVLGTRRLARLVGAERARQIQQVAQTLDAAAALSAGLVSVVQDVNAWEAIVTEQVQAASLLSPAARVSLYRVLHVDTDDADMSELVRSVVTPGLKQRIAKYRAEG